ncbi:MAG: hypothetical protein QW653_08395 [Candidatus Nitrosocaldus sp.]
MRSSIVSFNFNDNASDMMVGRVVKDLEREGIIVAERDVLKKKIVRVSPHFFNSEDDIARFLATLKRLLVLTS